MYHVSAQGVDERMININYYYCAVRTSNSKQTKVVMLHKYRCDNHPTPAECNIIVWVFSVFACQLASSFAFLLIVAVLGFLPTLKVHAIH